MTRSDLIDRLASQYPQLQLKDADMVVRVILDTMSAALARGDRIEIRGFGSFALNYRPPRNGRNPKSGARECSRQVHASLQGR
jgi:integration host factor subunit beta